MKNVREEVCWFAEIMESQLAQNDHKPGWKNDSLRSLLKRIREEVDELGSAIEKTHDDRHARALDICSEAADVANFAMMISDLVRVDLDGIGAPWNGERTLP